MACTPAPRLILSPCGTSLLTNGSSNDERRLLNRHSNTRSLDVMGTDRAAVEKRVATVRARMSAPARRTPGVRRPNSTGS